MTRRSSFRSPGINLHAAIRTARRHEHRLPSGLGNEACRDFRRRVWMVKLAEGLLAALFGIAVSYLFVFGWIVFLKRRAGCVWRIMLAAAATAGLGLAAEMASLGLAAAPAGRCGAAVAAHVSAARRPVAGHRGTGAAGSRSRWAQRAAGAGGDGTGGGGGEGPGFHPCRAAMRGIASGAGRPPESLRWPCWRLVWSTRRRAMPSLAGSRRGGTSSATLLPRSEPLARAPRRALCGALCSAGAPDAPETQRSPERARLASANSRR